MMPEGYSLEYFSMPENAAKTGSNPRRRGAKYVFV
jgi:hypothetical protein